MYRVQLVHIEYNFIPYVSFFTSQNYLALTFGLNCSLQKIS